ncbi:dephospho-CoA kinase [Thermomonas alba]|uniref:dephospho-CoA kinase n=1 Tax=Thermomonas alba TaxID=2888525 RepID=UPI001F03B0B3|nr:dephospho-CoA kinase [Thermomonas alba]
MSAYVIGLTGGVASGKSLAESAFQALGIVVTDADAAARAALAVGSAGLDEVVAAFGSEVLAADGSLDRAAMRRRIFADAQAKRVLEGIVHPRVRAALHAACQAAASPYAIASIPLLAEVGGRSAYPWLRRILVIDADETTRLARLQARDGIDAGLARRMLAAQASRAQRLAIADDVIRNDGTPEALLAQVAAMDRLYRRLAAA